MNDTWYDMGLDTDMSWMYNWKGKEKEITISETKKKIVIDNYFKKECDVNTSIREAFTKGFELGLKKAPQPKIGYCKDCKYFKYDIMEEAYSCKRWGSGILRCRTKKDGYCFLFEPQKSEE